MLGSARAGVREAYKAQSPKLQVLEREAENPPRSREDAQSDSYAAAEELLASPGGLVVIRAANRRVPLEPREAQQVRKGGGGMLLLMSLWARVNAIWLMTRSKA